jgi:hypothetical protein
MYCKLKLLISALATSLAALLMLAPLVVNAADAPPIKIGFGMALSGPLAGGGKSALVALQMWAEDVNARGGILGRPVQFIHYDDQSNPEICLERTVGYVRDRKQFGKPIGSNQAIKHMAADAALMVETMRAAVECAGWSFDQASRGGSAELDEAAMAVLTARSFVGANARSVIERCIQMHGAIAFTWEYGLHRHLRRVLYRANTLVRPLQSRERIAALILPKG